MLARPNLVPSAYRGVAVTEVTCELDEASLAAHFVGLEAYRRTRFVVVRRGQSTPSSPSRSASRLTASDPLFAPITAVALLAGPDDCAFVVRPDLDTAVPTALGRAALEDAPGKRGVAVQGRYGHVSFIVDPALYGSLSVRWFRPTLRSCTTRPDASWRSPSTCRRSTWSPRWWI